MDIIEIIKKKIYEIEQNLNDIKKYLDKLAIIDKPKTVSKQETAIPSNEELRREYQKLYDLYNQGNITQLKEIIERKTVKYLKAFCKANSLPIDASKFPKNKIIEEILQWMAQKRAITKKI